MDAASGLYRMMITYREMKMERAVRAATTPKDRADVLLVADTLGLFWLYHMPSIWRIVKAYGRLD